MFSADDPNGIAVPGLGGADNLAHYSNNSGHITLADGNLYGSSSITVALFFKAGPAQEVIDCSPITYLIPQKVFR